METEEAEVKDKEVREGGVKVKEEEEDKGKEVEEDFPIEEGQEGEMLTEEAQGEGEDRGQEEEVGA